MKPWLQLLRLPAVFTAFADIFLGFLLTHRGFEPVEAFLSLLTASGCLYLSGMVWNDIFDRHDDAKDRPERPIPSGKISVGQAAGLAVTLMAAGIIAAAQVGTHSVTMGVAVVGAIFAYDALLKRTPVGPVGMGLCRFFNVLLGASAVADPERLWSGPPVWAAAGLGLYIVGVTWFARDEHRQSARRQLGLALLVMAAGVGTLALLVAMNPRETRTTSLILLAVVFVTVSQRALRVIGDAGAGQVQGAVKSLLLSYVFLCAALVYWQTGSGQHSLATAALVVPAMYLGRLIRLT